jgi:hypothetical protein
VEIDAVNRFCDVVVEEPVREHNPALEELRNRLLQEPLAFFKSSQRKTGPAQRARPHRAGPAGS